MKAAPVVIVGGGAAGLMAALCLAPREVLLLCGGRLGGNAASGWAQGGIAAAIGADDSAALHVADTVAAGAGLCDPAAVERIIGGGPWAIEKLLSLGAKFDAGLGLEAAHRRRRIVHAKDSTGAEIMRALTEVVRQSSHISIVENAVATALAVAENIVRGVQFRDPGGAHSVAAAAVIVATGGVGGLFADTTNPRWRHARARCCEIWNLCSFTLPLWPAGWTRCR
jgi:L-aspartate oxidase